MKKLLYGLGVGLKYLCTALAIMLVTISIHVYADDGTPVGYSAEGCAPPASPCFGTVWGACAVQKKGCLPKAGEPATTKCGCKDPPGATQCDCWRV